MYFQRPSPPLAGNLLRVSRSGAPPLSAKKVEGARARGIRYEDKCHRELQPIFEKMGFRYLKGMWFFYETRGQKWGKYCQTDALAIGEDGRLIIIECKLKHCLDAFEQLRYLYEPVVDFFYKPTRLASLEVCRFFDPDIDVGMEFSLLERLEDIQYGCRQVYIHGD